MPKSRKKRSGQRKFRRASDVANAHDSSVDTRLAGLSKAIANHETVAPNLRSIRIGFGIILAVLFVWAYWGTWHELMRQWNTTPDYSHGYLVPPVAAFFLYLSWSRRPMRSNRLCLSGLWLLAVAAAMRLVAAKYFVTALDGWSIPFWVAGSTVILCGWPTLRWSLPAVLFLFFMVPLPYNVERLLALPLQSISSAISCFALQCLQLPSVREGNSILLGERVLEVARACSGLRIFFGISALCFAFVVVFRRSNWVKGLMVLAIIPVALTANSARIVSTGLLYHFGFGETAQRFSHDVAGWFMIPFAALLFGVVLLYLDRLITMQIPLSGVDMARSSAATSLSTKL